MTRQLILAVGQWTDPGRVRDHNEDSLAAVPLADLAPDLVERLGQLFLVADGMGGHAAGAIASHIAAEQVMQAYYAGDAAEPRQSLERAIRLANAAIFDQSRENPAYAGMGTTLVGIVCQDSRMIIVNVGDSRAYLVRDGGIRQLTEDHSWVGEAMRQGTLTAEQARYHPRRNVITRSLGNRPDVEMDFFQEGLLPGDTLVLCSDGLSGQVYDQEICDMVLALEPQAAAEQLVALANERGGPDNITVIVVRVVQVAAESKSSGELPFVLLGCLGLIMGALALAFAAFWLLPPLLPPAPTMGPTAMPTQQPAPSAVPPTTAAPTVPLVTTVPTVPPATATRPAYPSPVTTSPTVSAPPSVTVPAYPPAGTERPSTVPATASPTVTVAPTATLTPMATIAPTATLTPTATIAPTATATPTATLALPTSTVAPTATITPSATITGTVNTP